MIELLRHVAEVAAIADFRVTNDNLYTTNSM